MRVFLISAFVLASTGAFAQDISMCTNNGFSVKCCKQSLAKHGPFGTAQGQAKALREADMQKCMAGAPAAAGCTVAKCQQVQAGKGYTFEQSATWCPKNLSRGCT